MKLLHLPPILLASFFESVLAKDTITGVPATGSGPEYASACTSAINGWIAGSKAWAKDHEILSTTTQGLGGTRLSTYTVYENASTLCDGHARVTYSPAKSIGLTTKTLGGPVTGTTTIVGTYYSPAWDPPYPSCKISPSDCDPLWTQYHRQVAAAATITPAPKTTIATPPCANQTAASENDSFISSLYGCGKCTIYGDGVELVYFPTSASRDMCATTPTDTITHYGKGAVITAYAGTNYQGPEPANGAETAVVDGHTFTSGTAYISISRVYAVDRCTKTYGSVVSNAILAMPSESVLSLRYRQNHFQFLQETDTQTGYPVSYADFNKPIPFSAWIGQNKCDIGIDETMCGIIYENDFRPQLAIPPEIKQLSPDFANCQMWYNGLWDPPLALTQYSEAAKPTLPYGPKQTTSEPASPSSSVVAPTATATALANELPSSEGHSAASTYSAQGSQQSSHGVHGGATLPHAGTTATSIGSAPVETAANEHASSTAANDGGSSQGTNDNSGNNGDELGDEATTTDSGSTAPSESGSQSSGNDAGVVTVVTTVSGTRITTTQQGTTQSTNIQSATNPISSAQTTGGAMGYANTMHSSVILAIFVLALVAA